MSPAERYRLCPQLEAYDALLPTLAPYVTFTSPRRFQSAVVTTDDHGFRRSSARGGWVDSATWPASAPAGIVLGGSFVFGVGATSDAQTMASHLNAAGRGSFLNLGIRAANSTQELIAAIPFLERADTIVVCSGINTLLVNLQSLGINDMYGPFFDEGRYDRLRDRPLVELEQRVADAVSPRSFARQALREVGQLMTGGTGDGGTAAGGVGAGDTETAFARAVALQRRDLRMLARSCRPGARLIFVAQPFAPVCLANPSPEEQALFALTEQPGDGSAIVMTTLASLWPRYVAALRQACADDAIPFADLGLVPWKGWSFVDRVHMTDAGYRQAADFLAADALC